MSYIKHVMAMVVLELYNILYAKKELISYDNSLKLLGFYAKYTLDEF